MFAYSCNKFHTIKKHEATQPSWEKNFLAAFIPYSEVKEKVTFAEQVSQAEPLSL